MVAGCTLYPLGPRPVSLGQTDFAGLLGKTSLSEFGKMLLAEALGDLGLARRPAGPVPVPMRSDVDMHHAGRAAIRADAADVVHQRVPAHITGELCRRNARDLGIDGFVKNVLGPRRLSPHALVDGTVVSSAA